MQFSDFFNPGNDLVDTVKTVLFRMLPRGAQIKKVRVEINNGLLKKYGKITKLEIDKENKTINADLDLKGEKEGVRISLSNYGSSRKQAKILCSSQAQLRRRVNRAGWSRSWSGSRRDKLAGNR